LLLGLVVRESEHMQDLYADALLKHGDGEWDLIVAWDEFTPRNKRRPDNIRKTMVLSYNFTQLGVSIRSDFTWMIPVTIRSCKLASIRGGFPRILKIFMEKLLFGPHGLMTAGVPLTIHGEIVVMKAHVRHLFSDGDGLRAGLDWKGHASFRPCFRHLNVLKLGSDLAHRHDSFVEISCTNHSAFQLSTASDLEETVALLRVARERFAAGRWSKEKCETLSKSLGFNDNEEGLLMDDRLRLAIKPLQVGTYDWVHTLFQDGVMNNAVFLLLEACKQKAGLEMKELEVFFRQALSFPHMHHVKSSNLWRLFDEYHMGRSDAPERFKCSASDMLALYALLRYFIETRFREHPDRHALGPELRSFAQTCKVADALLLMKRGSISLASAAVRLRSATSEHIRLQVAAYGEATLRPKNHWLFDISDLLSENADLEVFMDAFVVERLHLSVNMVAEPLQNTTTYEKSVQAGLLNNQLRRLREYNGGLVGKVPRASESICLKCLENLLSFSLKLRLAPSPLDICLASWWKLKMAFYTPTDWIRDQCGRMLVI
jgi:hypothetical protein